MSVIESEGATIDLFANFLKHHKHKKSSDVYDYQYAELIAGMNMEYKTLVIKHYDLYSLEGSDKEFDIYSYFFNSKNVEYYLRLLNEALRKVWLEYHPDDTDFPLTELQARLSIEEEDSIIKMNEINITNRGKLIAFNALITAKSEVKNTVKEKKFKCHNCGDIYNKKAANCANEECGPKTIVLSLDDSVLADCEYLELQERQSDLKSTSTTPIKLNSIVFGDLVGRYKAGDNVRVIGIMKMQKSVSDAVLNRTQDEDFATDIFFERIVEIHNLDLLSTTENTIINDPSKYLTKKDEQDILRFRKNYSDDTQLMNILVNSFAPHIYGHEEIKQSILLQNVGAIEIDREDFKTRKRIHILLVGDPGTYKSQLLTAAMKLSINGHMASGKGITGVGITASVERDGKGIARVRIGKAVYANKGHVSLDEFLQVKQDDQGYLLDILESGIFRVDKAGINVMLNADASYLVATNPDNGRYNAHNSLFDNLTISPQMFSRFHMVWVLLDIVNQKEDRKKALHIMSSFDQTVVQKNKDYKKEEWDKIRISNDLLFKYLLYAQTHNTSDITIEQAAMDIFLEYYSKIRTPEKSSDITATGRQFVGILMFAYARCRLMLRDIVTEKDAEETVNLLNKSYKSCGILIEGTGGLNLTMKFGKPLYEIKDKKQCFTRAVEDLTVNPETREVTPVTKSTIVDALIVDARWLKSEAEEFFDKMYDANKMLRNTVGEYQLTNS